VSKKHRHPPKQPQELVRSNPAGGAFTAVTQSVTFTGPLPHPAILARYNEAIPNGAERIVAMAESQSAHRERIELMVVQGNVQSQARGTNYAFILCLAALIGGFALLFTGRSAEGWVSILGSLSAVAGVFIYGRSKQGKERVEKSSALTRKSR
jgi:uncharacterized membrane protein